MTVTGAFASLLYRGFRLCMCCCECMCAFEILTAAIANLNPAVLHSSVIFKQTQACCSYAAELYM